jgi:hypothetical protein
MYKLSLVKQTQSDQKLLCENADQGRTKPTESVLFYQFVEINAKKFKNETKMRFVDEGILQSQDVILVTSIELCVERIQN